MNRTNKSDWFSDLLSESGYIVSGHQSFAKLLGLTNDICCTIRLIHKGQFLKIIFLVEVPLIDNFNFIFNQTVLKNICRLFGNDVFIIVFDSNHFSISTDQGSNFSQKNSDELENIFSAMNSDLTKNKGTLKAINKTENDGFQTWTRAHLTKYCTINDIDALNLQSGDIVLELKRVEESVETWMPYLDDYSNYSSLLSIARKFSLRPRVIAYSATNTEKVALHVRLALDPSRRHIDGKFILLVPKIAIADQITEPEENFETYRSKNRRRY